MRTWPKPCWTSSPALDAELLVIGARRRSPVGKLFLGSVTQSIILHADVPVLVVKAPAEK